jgi:hypothetical protein
MQPGRLRYKLPGGLVAHASRVHEMGLNAQARRPRHKDGRSLMARIVGQASRLPFFPAKLQAKPDSARATKLAIRAYGQHL